MDEEAGIKRFKRLGGILMKKIKEIIGASIETKQRLLADENLLKTICDTVECNCKCF